MVNEKVLIRTKFRRLKKVSKFMVILTLILAIILVTFFIGFLLNKPPVINQNKIVIENPLKEIVFANKNEQGLVDKQQVINQALQEFDKDYINYILLALGVTKLKRSLIGYGNPKVEFKIDEELWSSEIIDQSLNTQKSTIDDPDVRFHMPKTEIIESLLSSDINQFVINSVSSGNTQIELIASKPELLSKGYLGMYKDLTGSDPNLE
ncbi:hypothetical protein CMI38_06815 [Candidatus Pacearchaeota archaeon]|jgi:hypothetical protein|nr:hypothetical protein [Candidatus Pacearchaeota archaeon]|tara:strand:- start:3455 stop:4078 length:624 start_codon:yes stop_codon:yes gene_type:complete